VARRIHHPDIPCFLLVFRDNTRAIPISAGCLLFLLIFNLEL
jgi:hypothetical protein